MERSAGLSLHARASVPTPKRLLALRSDERLVERVRGGDERAFEVLYERHVAGVLGFCRHMLGSQQEAEDAVQQAFVSAHRDMLRGDRQIAFKSWLYTIARNRSISMLRARREQPAELDEPSSTAGLHEDVERRGDLRQLVADVGRLPEDQRAALVLTELGDLSHAEVAEVIGQRSEAVKSLVFRARSSLIERREARDADCGEIRAQLAVATGGTLRKSHLRYHLESCPGCAAYLDEVRRQRKLLGIALPVVPTLALQESVMASVGIGGAAGAAGATSAGVASTGAVGALASGAATTGVPLIGGTVAKVAIVGVLAAGTAGVATEVARDGRDDGSDAAPAQQAPARGDESRGADGDGSGAGVRRSEERSHGRRGAERRERGQRRAFERSRGRSAAGIPRGAKGRPGEPGQRGRGKVVETPGKGVGRDGQAPGKGRAPGAGDNRAVPAPPVVPGGTAEPEVPERAPPASSKAPASPPAHGKGKAGQSAE
jgi:RNA polymerase sigma factor (sigma-70 family)